MNSALFEYMLKFQIVVQSNLQQNNQETKMD